MTPTIAVLRGEDRLPAIPELARLRIAVFAEYPYLYDGDASYEEEYLREFVAAPEAVLVTASSGGSIVGAATASPLAAQAEEIRGPVESFGVDPAAVFYFGESVLLSEFRGHGIGHAFFDHREAQALACGATLTMFAAVVRPDDHPARPANYRPLDSFWRKRGYAPVPGLRCSIEWREHGETEDSPKPLQFWQRNL